MLKNKVHKVGKTINKPVKFIKNNIGTILTVGSFLGGPAIINKLTNKNKK
ncbi:hypothetical protein ACRPLU_09575 [Streptococcus uberis]|nr:hypothetical protein [Streptococcus uberis]MCK1201028.1 hypothetical protein [Streptococcus uberis]